MQLNKEEVGKFVKFWKRAAEEDFVVAKDLFRLKHYMPALFFVHLSVEKLLKALYTKATYKYPPATHNLVRLARLSKIPLSEKEIEVLAEITTFNVEARYDIYKRRLYKKANKEYTEKFIKLAEDFVVKFKGYL